MYEAKSGLRQEITNLLERIDEIYPLLQAEAETGERLRRPTPSVQTALEETGIFMLSVPESLGGLEATPLEILHVIEHISHCDASIGWLVRVLTGETAIAATFLSEQAAQELFESDEKPRIAGQSTGFTGRAVREGDSYRVYGSGKFMPGLTMATHVNVAVTVEETGEQLVCVVPRSELFMSDNWDMLGLLATASLDYEAQGVLVNEKYTFSVKGQSATRRGMTGRLSPNLVDSLKQAAWSQGLGRRMLDELKSIARNVQHKGSESIRSNEFFYEYGRHYSHVRGTMALLCETWTGYEETLLDDGVPTQEQETMARLATNLATRTALEISQIAHRFAGGYIMRKSTLQRLFRDSHAGTQHRGTRRMITAQCGQILTGVLPEGTTWGFDELEIPEDNMDDYLASFDYW